MQLQFALRGKTIAMILLLIVAVYIILQIMPYNKKVSNSPFERREGQAPLVIAHGGAKLLNPENTWLAFNYARALGVDALELDLRITADGVLLTQHDENVSSYTFQEGLVSEYTYAALRQLNYGYNFQDLEGNYPYRQLTEKEIAAYNYELAPASLEELFASFGREMLYVCELKDSGILGEQSSRELLRLIQVHHLETNVFVATFDYDTLQYFESIAPDTIATGMEEKTSKDFVIANYAGFGIFKNYNEVGMSWPLEQSHVPLDTKYLINKIHKNNMFVMYWTINDKETMSRLTEKGADGIITDRPDIMLQLLQEMGYERDK